MKVLCIYCCGGMGREILDMASGMRKWEKIVFVDDTPPAGRIVNGTEVNTLEEAVEKYSPVGMEFIVTAGEPMARKSLHEKLRSRKLKFTSFFPADFSLSKHSKIGAGTIIHSGAVLTCNVETGEGCLVNKSAVIAHDVSLGDYCVVSDNAAIGGGVNVGNLCFIGAGAAVRNGIRIGGNTIIGMGSVVVKDAPAGSVLWGNPARVMRENRAGRVFQDRSRPAGGTDGI